MNKYVLVVIILLALDQFGSFTAVYAAGYRTQIDPIEVMTAEVILLGGFSLAYLKGGWRNKKLRKQMNSSVVRSAIFTGLLVGCVVSSSTIILSYESVKEWASFAATRVFTIVMAIAVVNFLISYRLSSFVNLKRGTSFMRYSGIALSLGFATFLLPLTVLSEQIVTLIISSLNGVIMGVLPILFGMEAAVTRAMGAAPDPHVV